MIIIPPNRFTFIVDGTGFLLHCFYTLSGAWLSMKSAFFSKERTRLYFEFLCDQISDFGFAFPVLCSFSHQIIMAGSYQYFRGLWTDFWQPIECVYSLSVYIFIYEPIVVQNFRILLFTHYIIFQNTDIASITLFYRRWLVGESQSIHKR